MLTGDHPATGVAIARQIGILDRSAPKSAVMVRPTVATLAEHELMLA
jgi:magnesium-transporting ATPase (P-type)